MNIIFVSIPISLLLLAIAIWAFFWAVRSGQYDDLDSPAYSILLDEETDRRKRQRDETGVERNED